MITRSRFNGVRFSHRNRWLLLNNGILDRCTFMILEFCIDMAVWNKPDELFGVAQVTHEEIAHYLGYKDASSMSKPIRRLFMLGLLKQKKKNQVQVMNIRRYLQKSISGGVAIEKAKSEKNLPLRQLLDSMQIEVGNNQEEHFPGKEDVDSNQENFKALATKSLGQASDSFNVHSSSLIPSVSWSDKTDNAIEAMLKEIGCTRLMPEDIRLIDQIEDGKIKT